MVTGKASVPIARDRLDNRDGSVCSAQVQNANATDLTPDTTYEIDFTFTLTCGGSSMTVPGSIIFTTTNDGSSTDTTATESTTGTWLPSGSLTQNCTVTGSATLTSSGSTFSITINGSATATLGCGGTTTGSKSFSIGPSSMEGDLHISPGDWVSGGYNFKFISGSHGATMYTVVATVTVPVTCPDNTVQNILIPLGAPGQLDGGGVTSFTYNIAAGDTSNHATNNQNSILAWEGAVQAPASLCGGSTGRNQIGAVFNATVTRRIHTWAWLIGNSITAARMRRARATSIVPMRATRAGMTRPLVVRRGAKLLGTHKIDVSGELQTGGRETLSRRALGGNFSRSVSVYQAYGRDLFPTRCSVAAATEEAG